MKHDPAIIIGEMTMGEGSEVFVLSDQERAFHTAEFTELRSEVSTLVKNSSDNLRYAAATLAAVSVWLATRDENIAVPRLAWWIPTAVVVAMGAFSLASYSQIGRIAGYLRALETSLGHDSLGWEKAFRGDAANPGKRSWTQRIPTFGLLHAASWILLLVAACVVGDTRLRSGQSANGQAVSYLFHLAANSR